MDKWTKYWVLSAAGKENTNGDLNNIIFTIKDTKLYFPVVTLSAKTIKDYQNFPAKNFKDQFIGMDI